MPRTEPVRGCKDCELMTRGFGQPTACYGHDAENRLDRINDLLNYSITSIMQLETNLRDYDLTLIAEDAMFLRETLIEARDLTLSRDLINEKS